MRHLLTALGLALPLTCAAQAYKCTVAGKVEYQQQPCSAGGEKLKVDEAPQGQDRLDAAYARAMNLGIVVSGMSEAQMKRACRGGPTSINLSQSSSGPARAQWVYESCAGRRVYVYTEDGIVTSAQYAF